VWMLHDHKERAFTTDGMHPGGSVALLYRARISMSTVGRKRTALIGPVLFPRYYKREIPVGAYDPIGIFGEAGARAQRWPRAVLLGFVIGALLGLFWYWGARYCAESRKCKRCEWRSVACFLCLICRYPGWRRLLPRSSGA
jgi:hypothetical protein